MNDIHSEHLAHSPAVLPSLHQCRSMRGSSLLFDGKGSQCSPREFYLEEKIFYRILIHWPDLFLLVVARRRLMKENPMVSNTLFLPSVPISSDLISLAAYNHAWPHRHMVATADYTL